MQVSPTLYYSEKLLHIFSLEIPVIHHITKVIVKSCFTFIVLKSLQYKQSKKSQLRAVPCFYFVNPCNTAAHYSDFLCCCAGHRAGTTAAVTLLRGGVELAVGHVGDSRVILCRLGGSRELTQDHCPSRLAEKVCRM